MLISITPRGHWTVNHGFVNHWLFQFLEEEVRGGEGAGEGEEGECLSYLHFQFQQGSTSASNPHKCSHPWEGKGKKSHA